MVGKVPPRATTIAHNLMGLAMTSIVWTGESSETRVARDPMIVPAQDDAQGCEECQSDVVKDTHRTHLLLIFIPGAKEIHHRIRWV